MSQPLDVPRLDEHLAMLGHLASTLSHAIRNPLGALFILTDVLAEELQQPAADHSTEPTTPSAALHSHRYPPPLLFGTKCARGILLSQEEGKYGRFQTPGFRVKPLYILRLLLYLGAELAYNIGRCWAMYLHPPQCVLGLRLQHIPGAFLRSETTWNLSDSWPRAGTCISKQQRPGDSRQELPWPLKTPTACLTEGARP
jgi:hypothetical protein